jgi:hypothetical protein
VSQLYLVKWLVHQVWFQLYCLAKQEEMHTQIDHLSMMCTYFRQKSSMFHFDFPGTARPRGGGGRGSPPATGNFGWSFLRFWRNMRQFFLNLEKMKVWSQLLDNFLKFLRYIARKRLT